MGKLHELARASNDAVSAKALIDGGAQLDEKDKMGSAPLHYASRYGNDRIAAELVAAGALLDTLNNKGQSPLYQAVVGQHGHIVAQLLESSADPNTISSTGYSALHYAARNGLSGITRTLLGAAADCRAKTAEGHSAVELAIEYKQDTIVALLRQFEETGSCEGVDIVDIEAEDEDEAELMRELAAEEIMPDVQRAEVVREIVPPGHTGGGGGGKQDGGGGGKQAAGGGSGAPPPPQPQQHSGDGCCSSHPPAAEAEPEGFGRVYVGAAPPPHLMQQVGTSGGVNAGAGSPPLPPDVIEYATSNPDYNSGAPPPAKELPEYAVVDRNRLVSSSPAGMDTYDNAEAGGMDTYDNAEANPSPTSTIQPDVAYEASVRPGVASVEQDRSMSSSASPGRGGATVYSAPEFAAAEDPMYASIDDFVPPAASPAPGQGLLPPGESLAEFLARLSLQEQCQPPANAAGIDSPEDFKLFTEVELTGSHGFKIGHVRKIFKALGE